MKTCRYCRAENLHDDAVKCPHCGAWLDWRGGVFQTAKIVITVFLMVFVLGLAACGLITVW